MQKESNQPPKPDSSHRYAGSVSLSILHSSFLILLGTLVVKSVGLLKEIVIAAQFGLSSELDIFLLVFGLVGLLSCAVLGSMQLTLVPVLVRLNKESPDVFLLEFRCILKVFVYVGLAIMLTLLVLSSPITMLLGSRFEAHHYPLIFKCLITLSLYIILSAFTLGAHAHLQAKKRFLLGALLPTLTPLTILCFLHFNIMPNQGTFVLALATLIGTALEFIFLFLVLLREHLWLWPKWRSKSKYAAQVFKNSLHLIWGALMASSTIFVDYIMSTHLGPGAVSSLSYASKIPTVLIGFAISTVATAVLPYLTELLVQSKLRTFHIILKRYMLVLFLSGALIAMIGINYSAEIVHFCFQRGHFSTENADFVASLQNIYLLSIPIYVLSVMPLRALLALGHQFAISRIATSAFITNITLNWLLMQVLGAHGIAWATVLVYAQTALLTTITLKKVAPNVAAQHLKE